MANPHYETLTPHERFALMTEAMARGDDVEADLLGDKCPQFTYRCDDAEFRDRMKRAYHIAMAVALNMRAGLARVEMAENFRRLSDHFADGPITLAQTAFLYGRAYGHWEAGKIDTIELHDREQHAAEVSANPVLKQQLEELRECGREVTRRLTRCTTRWAKRTR
jgi:hypothetical protein